MAPRGCGPQPQTWEASGLARRALSTRPRGCSLNDRQYSRAGAGSAVLGTEIATVERRGGEARPADASPRLAGRGRPRRLQGAARICAVSALRPPRDRGDADINVPTRAQKTRSGNERGCADDRASESAGASENAGSPPEPAAGRCAAGRRSRDAADAVRACADRRGIRAFPDRAPRREAALAHLRAQALQARPPLPGDLDDCIRCLPEAALWQEQFIDALRAGLSRAEARREASRVAFEVKE